LHEYGRGSYHDWRLLWHHLVSAVRYFNKWGWWFDPERRRINTAALDGMLLGEGESRVVDAGEARAIRKE
jgi:hypothetical protein